MTSWNTGAAVSNGAPSVASFTVTIPAGVAAGDVLLVGVAAFNPPSGTETLQASSTGTAPAIIGAQQHILFDGFDFFGALYSVVAGASDAGKVITASFVSGDHANWAIGLGAWHGASNAAPVDVSGVATASGNGSTITCPSETTGVAGDWDIQIIAAALGGSAYTGGSGFTQRESVSDPSSGATVAIFDSNGPVGPSGTGIGGAAFANAGNNSWWAGWTVGLAPVPGVPHTATAALAVTPSLAAARSQGHARGAALAVTPQLAAQGSVAGQQISSVIPAAVVLGLI